MLTLWLCYVVEKSSSYRFPDKEFQKELSKFSSLRNTDAHLKVRVRIHLCKMVVLKGKGVIGYTTQRKNGPLEIGVI